MRRAVSLYSYQQAYYLRELTLEQCVQVAVAAGAEGIEVIGEQMMPGFPALDVAFYASWKQWMRRYGAIPLVHDMFLDIQVRKNRPLDFDGQVELLRRNIQHTARLGCRYLRMVVTTPPEVVAQVIPYATKHSVVPLLEVHTPWHIEHEWIQQHLEVYSRFGPDMVGIIPDFGIFVARFPRLQGEHALRAGARPEIVKHIIQAYDAASGGATGPADLGFLIEDVGKMGGSAADIALAKDASRHVWSPPATLLGVMPYVHHVHGKFWEMTNEGQEYSIPYPQLITTLRQGGYDGYITSEYEGQLWLRDIDQVDEVGAVGHHQAMLARLINEGR